MQKTIIEKHWYKVKVKLPQQTVDVVARNHFCGVHHVVLLFHRAPCGKDDSSLRHFGVYSFSLLKKQKQET